MEIEKLKQKEPVFLNDWKESKINGVISDFDGTYSDTITEQQKENWSDKNILFASYNYQCYSGDAWLLFEKDGKLFEVNGSHCSCYGLENQFEPEEVQLKELKNRLLNGSFGTDSYCGNDFKNELIDFLELKN